MDKQELLGIIQELKNKVDLLYADTTIPYEVGEAFKKRLQALQGSPNTTNASTQTQTVHESGSGTYDVAKPMAGFINIVVNGVTRQVPYY